MASKNIPAKTLLLAIADLVEEFPHLHDQEHWETLPEEEPCGTKACIAGWACILGTDDFKQKSLKVGDADEKGIFWIPKKRVLREYEGMEQDVVEDLSYSGRINRLSNSYYSSTGAELLGLDGYESDLLFHGEGRPRDDMSVSEALRAIANGADVADVWTDGTDDDYDGDDSCNCDSCRY